mmetsp:Transcript_34667/g.62415  ORF Transcript_34667/g.62415 Transcript_34667/m.62415 type:complete len:264 (-) Transcript_34667:140-931(-)
MLGLYFHSDNSAVRSAHGESKRGEAQICSHLECVSNRRSSPQGFLNHICFGPPCDLQPLPGWLQDLPCKSLQGLANLLGAPSLRTLAGGESQGQRRLGQSDLWEARPRCVLKALDLEARCSLTCRSSASADYGVSHAWSLRGREAILLPPLHHPESQSQSLLGISGDRHAGSSQSCCSFFESREACHHGQSQQPRLLTNIATPLGLTEEGRQTQGSELVASPDQLKNSLGRGGTPAHENPEQHHHLFRPKAADFQDSPSCDCI